MNFVVENEKELTDKVFHVIKNYLKGGFVCGLSGDLGAGKTTLVQQLAKKLGIKDPVTSPTFNLRKEYPLPKPVKGAKILQHIDLYRIDNPSRSDLENFNDWISDEKAVSFVEWPEKIENSDRLYDLMIHLEDKGQGKRQVELKWI